MITAARPFTDRVSRRVLAERWLISAWIVAFIAFYVATFVFRLGTVHFFYPFSNLDFYSRPAALPPYDEHRPWPIDLGQISILDGTNEIFVHPGGLDLILRYRLVDKARKIESSLDERIGLARAAGGQIQSRWRLRRLGTDEWLRPTALREVRFWGATFHFPPYPEPPGWRLVHRGLVGVYEVETGRVRAVHAEPVRGEGGSLRGVDILTAGYRRPEGAVLTAGNPYDLSTPAAWRRLEGAWSVGPPTSEGRVPVSFRLAVPERLPRHTHLVIAVREAGGATVDVFRGPAFVW